MNLQVEALNIFATATGWLQESDSDLGHAFVRYADGTLTVIKMPVGEEESDAAGINSRGVVVGWWLDSTGITHGYTWEKTR